MKASQIITFFLAVFAFVRCAQFSEKEKVDPWQLIPHDSFAVWELSTLKVVDSVFDLPMATQAAPYLSVSEKSSAINYLVALKQSGNRVSSFIVMPNAWIKWDSVAGGQKFRKRMYEGISLWEMGSNNGQLILSEISGFGVVSDNSLFVEEAIRQFRKGAASIKTKNHSLFQTHTSRGDMGDVFVSGSGLAKVLENEFDTKITNHLLQLFNNAVADATLSDNKLLFQGFASDSSLNEYSLLSTFQFQNPVANNLLSFTPIEFDFLVHLGVSEVNEWAEQRDLFFAGLDSAKSSGNKKRDQKEFYSSVDNEIALVVDAGHEALLIELKEIAKGMRSFRTSVEKAGTNRHAELFLDSDIYYADAPGLLQQLFSPLIKEIPQFYYASVSNVLVVTPDSDFLKKLLDNISQDETVAKSIEWRLFLEDQQQETNLTVLLNNKGRKLLKDFGSNGFLPRVEKASIQFSKVNRNFYVSSAIAIARHESGKIINREIALKERVKKIDIVKSHATEKDEVLFLLESQQIGLADFTGRTLWQRELINVLPVEAQQIDFLKNKKLQYLFLTNDGLHLIDRLGNTVKPFPVAFNLSKPAGLRVIDYDRSKNYRYLVTTEDGKIVLFDKEARPLEGWHAKPVGDFVGELPRHVRIDGSDLFVVPVADRIHVFNRRGESMKGFPFKLNSRFDGSFYVKDKLIKFVSRDGHLYSLNLSGEIVSDEVLLKNSQDAKFGLLNSRDFESCVIYKLEHGKLALIDIEGNILYETANPLSQDVKMKYYSFGKNRKIVSVFDEEQHLFYLLNVLTGQMLLKRPVSSQCEPDLSFTVESDELQVVYAVENKIMISTISLAY